MTNKFDYARLFCMSEKLLTPLEVAEILDVSHATVHAMLKRGDMAYRRYGPRLFKIEESEVKRFIDQSKKHGTNGNGQEVEELFGR